MSNEDKFGEQIDLWKEIRTKKVKEIWKQEKHKNKFMVFNKETKKIISVVYSLEKLDSTKFDDNCVFYEIKPINLYYVSDILKLFSKKIKLVFLTLFQVEDEPIEYIATDEQIFKMNNIDLEFNIFPISNELCKMLIEFICNKNLNYRYMPLAGAVDIQLCKIIKKIKLPTRAKENRNKTIEVVDNEPANYFFNLADEEKKNEYLKTKFTRFGFTEEEINYGLDVFKKIPNSTFTEIFKKILDRFY